MQEQEPMKTISQIAKEIGVSKAAIWKKLKNEDLKDKIKYETVTVGNTIHVNKVAEKLIKDQFIGNQLPVTIDNQSVTIGNQLPIDSNEVIRLLSQQLEVSNKQNGNLSDKIGNLIDELSKEREHSRMLSDKLTELNDKLAELASNAQKLHAVDMLPKKKKGLFGWLDARKAD